LVTLNVPHPAELLTFSELAQPERKRREFGLFRQHYNPTDIEVLLKNERLLVGVDALRRGGLTLGEVLEWVFGEPHPTPRDCPLAR
jgi:hypothetical protein